MLGTGTGAGAGLFHMADGFSMVRFNQVEHPECIQVEVPALSGRWLLQVFYFCRIYCYHCFGRTPKYDKARDRDVLFFRPMIRLTMRCESFNMCLFPSDHLLFFI